ncbi:restriction endonuclease subunit S [Caulobacter sp. CCG-8]|uniref:restriction endonuclease subunit S n=1 Tax=Caulobacter sp. CCG-8 TaxID=3127958 RepID=UPI00307F658C
MTERWRVPASWRWKALREIGIVVGGGTPNTRVAGNFDPSGTPWITPADLSGYSRPYISGGRRALSARGLASSGATLLPRSSVMFSSRAPIGYCVIAETEMATSQGFKSLILNAAMSPEYVRYYLLASVDYATSHARGTTFKELSGAKFGSLRIPVAPPQEQIRIAGRLKEANDRISQANAEIVATQQTIRTLRAAVLRAAFSGQLTRKWRRDNVLESSADLVARTAEIEATVGGRAATDRVVEGGVALRINGREPALPDGWSWQSLLRLAKQETGHTPSRATPAYWDGGVPWVGVKDAASHHGRVINDTLQTISESGLENSSARILPVGSVLLCRTAASIGYVCRLGRPMATSQDFAAWVCGPALNPAYLTYLLMGERDLLKRLGRGTAHPTVYLPEIRAFSIALAPLEEQAEIVSRLDALFERLAWIETEVDAAANLMPNLSRRLHDRAFRGQLELQKPNDDDVDVALSEHAPELGEKMPKRRVAQRGSPKANDPPLADQLSAKYDVWPASGYSFEDLREALTGAYDDVRTAIFAELRAKRLAQRFDERRRLMVFVRGDE